MERSYPLAAVLERLEAVDSIALLGVSPDLSKALDGAPRAAPAVFLLAETTGGNIELSGSPVQ